MVKLLKVKIKLASGDIHEMRTYANDEHITPEQAFDTFMHDGAEILEHEWVDISEQSK